MKDPVVLRVYRGEQLIAVKQFLSPQIVIGRQSDSGLPLDDELVSPLHAVIEEREDGYFISDLGSENGLMVSNVKVLETKLVSGDAINIGPYSIRFYIGVPSPASPPDYNKKHEKPEIPQRVVVETRVDEVSLQDDELPDLPIMPDQTNPSFAVADNEKTQPGVFADDEATVPSAQSSDFENTDPNIDLEEVTEPDIVVQVDPKKEESPKKESPKKESPKKEESPKNEIPKKVAPKETKPTAKDKSSGVVIQNRDTKDALDAQKSEPISGGYVAPASNYEKVDEIIYPYSRGSVLEVVVSWKERVLKTYHFSNKHQIFMTNSDGGDIYVPLIGGQINHKLVSFSDECIVHLPSTMNGELYYDNKKENLKDLESKSALIKPAPGGRDLKLDQGQMVKLDLFQDRVCAYIRFVEDTPGASKSPVFDFSVAELVGVFMSFATIAVIALYMLFYVPSTLNDTEDLLEDRLKKAVIEFKPPPRVKIPEVEPPPPEPVKKVVKQVTEKPQVKPQVKKVGEKAADKSTQTAKPKAAAPSRVESNKKVGSSRPGGAVKTGQKAANAATKKPDLTKTGILGVLGGGGANTTLDKVASGVGTTIGMADQKTGYQGQLSDQAGSGIGTKLQDAGKGGEGSAIAGVGDLKTSGRGGGANDYGTGGLGGKGNTTIIGIDGTGDEFSSTIDKDAIRRLIRKNRNAIKGCYDRALNTNKSISGKLVLSWQITNGGKMRSPRVKSSTLNNSQVEQCVISRLMVLTFPDPGPNEIAEVDYPFVFSRSN